MFTRKTPRCWNNTSDTQHHRGDSSCLEISRSLALRPPHPQSPGMHVCRLSHSADPRTPGGPPSRPAVRAWPERAPAWWRCRRCAACTGPPRGTPGRRAAGTGAASCSARPWSGCRWLSAGGGGVSTARGAEGTLQPRCSLCAAPSRESKHGMRERGRGKGAGPQPPPTALD